VPRIRAALDAGVPPLAVILRDPSHTEYNRWDLKLVAAYHIYEDMLVGNIPVHWDQSDRVTFDVKRGVSKSKAKIAATERAYQKRNAKNDSAMDGVYFYAVPRTMDGGPLPTIEEWQAEQAAKSGN
jgi:hypothetical protein